MAKGRVKLELDKEKFQQVVNELEQKNTFERLSELWLAVAETEWAKNLSPRPLTAIVASIRAKELDITTKAQPKLRVRLELDKDEFQKVINELEEKNYFDNLQELWIAVAETEWAKNLSPRPLTAQAAGIRAKELAIVTKVQPKRRGRKPKEEVDAEVALREEVKLRNDIYSKRNSGVTPFKGMPFIIVPAGDCPHKLNDLTFDGVASWCKKVVQTFLDNEKQLAPSGLCFFAGQFINVFSDEYRQVVDHIMSCKLDLYEGV